MNGRLDGLRGLSLCCLLAHCRVVPMHSPMHLLPAWNPLPLVRPDWKAGVTESGKSIEH